MLVAAPMLWAGNAVVGRALSTLIAPITLNLLRWALAFILLAPLAWRVLGIGNYNALQYLALQTSTPLNVTLVGSGMPVWMMLVGALFFGVPAGRQQVVGALLSVAGVLTVLCRGDWQQLLALRLVVGDVYMVLATISWAFYSWTLVRTQEPAHVRSDWSAFLLAQMVFGVAWSGVFTGVEWSLGAAPTVWGAPLLAGLAFIAVGPAILAYRFWGVGVQRAGPVLGGFFINLTPLFAALMSAAFLGERPQLYHALAFALIVAGIVVTSRRS